MANLPFDMLSGHAVEHAVGRTAQSASRWLLDWIRGRFVTLIGLWTGMVYFSAINQAPRYAAVSLILVAGVVVILLFLLVPAGYPAPKGSSHEVFEKNMATESVSLAVKSRPVRWFDLGDHETVNGCITPRGFLSLSTTVAKWLTPREAALMAAREEYYRRSGAWILILLIVLVWTLLGVLAASLLPSMNPVQAGLNGAAVMTTWCFLALFVWPTLNRFWMRRADSFLASLATPGEVRDLLSKIERLNATDIALSPAKTAVFHPIPPLQDRLSNLDQRS
jgi:flagellar basal body-associated protein FliL